MKTDIHSIIQFWNPSDPSNVDWLSFTSNQTEVMWLQTEMEILANEQSNRTGKSITEETLKRIGVLKRHGKWLAKLRYKFDAMETEIAELKRQNEYLKTKLPKVSLKDMKLDYVNGKIVYRKRAASDIPLGQLINHDNF